MAAIQSINSAPFLCRNRHRFQPPIFFSLGKENGPLTVQKKSAFDGLSGCNSPQSFKRELFSPIMHRVSKACTARRANSARRKILRATCPLRLHTLRKSLLPPIGKQNSLALRRRAGRLGPPSIGAVQFWGRVSAARTFPCISGDQRSPLRFPLKRKRGRAYCPPLFGNNGSII